MNIEKKYFDIEIGSDSFCIFESTSKSRTENSAFVLLKKIKNIVEKNLKYNNQCEDKYSDLPKPILLKVLKEIAAEIYTGYKEKADLSSWIARRYNSLEERIDELYSRINYCIPVSPLALALPLPKELIPQIVRFLSISDLGIFAQINRSGKAHALDAIVSRAEEYGYQGENPFEAIKYLIKLFKEISWANQIIPEKYYPRTATFRKYLFPLNVLTNLKKIDAKDFFTIVLNNKILDYRVTTTYTTETHRGKYILHITKEFCFVNFYRYLLKLLKGLTKEQVLREIDRRDEHGNTALLWAVWLNDKEAVKLLLEYGANIKIFNTQGVGAFNLALKQNYTEIVELLTAHSAAGLS